MGIRRLGRPPGFNFPIGLSGIITTTSNTVVDYLVVAGGSGAAARPRPFDAFGRRNAQPHAAGGGICHSPGCGPADEGICAHPPTQFRPCLQPEFFSSPQAACA